jgi:hypothetical protein
VRPLHNREAAAELTAPVPQRAGERVRGLTAGDESDRGQAAAPQQRCARHSAVCLGTTGCRRSHHGSCPSGAVVSAKTPCSGTANSITPSGLLATKPISRLVPVPSAFQTISRNDVFGGSPPIL